MANPEYKCPRCGIIMEKRISHSYCRIRYCANKNCNIGVVDIAFKNLLNELTEND